MIGRICNLIRMTKPSPERPGLLFHNGATVPTDTDTGYATGCIFQKSDGAAGTALYQNVGDEDSCAFVAIESVGTIAIADLSDIGATGYTAGKVLVADGDSFEEVAISSHATMAASGALTLATVTKTFAQALNSFNPGGSALSTAAAMSATPGADGAELGLAVTQGAPVLGASTNNTDATNYMGRQFVVPADYVVGEDLTVRISFLMTAAAHAQSDLDVVAKLVKAGALDATDLCATAAKDLKAVVAAADQDFIITGDSAGDELAPGSVIDIQIAAQRNDTGGSTAGTVQINGVDVLTPCYR